MFLINILHNCQDKNCGQLRSRLIVPDTGESDDEILDVLINKLVEDRSFSFVAWQIGVSGGGDAS